MKVDIEVLSWQTIGRTLLPMLSPSKQPWGFIRATKWHNSAGFRNFALKKPTKLKDFWHSFIWASTSIFHNLLSFTYINISLSSLFFKVAKNTFFRLFFYEDTSRLFLGLEQFLPIIAKWFPYHKLSHAFTSSKFSDCKKSHRGSAESRPAHSSVYF